MLLKKNNGQIDICINSVYTWNCVKSIFYRNWMHLWFIFISSYQNTN